jgi:uncharacterized protein (TIGR02996 family)
MGDDAFWAAIADRPDDDLPKLVFADSLDERGDPRGLCLRWVAVQKVRPARDTTGDTPTWDWWSRPPKEPDYYADADEVGSSILPAPLFRRLKGRPTDIWKGYPSYPAALQDLCAAWARCAADGVDPLGGGGGTMTA